MSSIPPNASKFLSKLVSGAPLILALAALVSSFAQWKPSSSTQDKTLLSSITKLQEQIVDLTNAQAETNKTISSLQIQQSDFITRQKVIAELEYSNTYTNIRQRFGNAVAERYLTDRKKIRDEILSGTK